MIMKTIATCLLLLASATTATTQTSAHAAETDATATKSVCIRFINLPYAEGKLFVAVSDGDKILEGSIADIDCDETEVELPLHKYDGRKIQLKAFQDLDGSGNLEFDEMGRPVEPVLLKNVEVLPELHAIDVELTSYIN